MMIVRADTGYFTAPTMNFIRVASRASWGIDDNLRRTKPTCR